jgi:hypothetical protein
MSRNRRNVRLDLKSGRITDTAARQLRATTGLKPCSKTIHHLITALVRGEEALGGIQRIAVGATVEPVAPCSLSGCMMNANS